MAKGWWTQEDDMLVCESQKCLTLLALAGIKPRLKYDPQYTNRDGELCAFCNKAIEPENSKPYRAIFWGEHG